MTPLREIRDQFFRDQELSCLPALPTKTKTSRGWGTQVKCCYVVAPSEAEVTRSTYLRKTPRGHLRAGGVKPLRRSAISLSLTSRVSLRLGMSKWMVSPSRTAAIGP